MIKIKSYDKESDFSTIIALFESRGMPPSFVHELPSFGFLAFQALQEDKAAVACGFLRTIENISMAMIDSFCSDPQYPSEVRNESLSLIGASLVRNARLMGKKKLILFTDDSHTLERARGFGFSNQGFKLYGLDLGDL